MREMHFLKLEKNKFTLYARGLLVVVLVLGIMLTGIQPAQATSYYVRDNFATVAYTNNDGTVNWAGTWTEINDNGTANGGNVQIITGELRVNSRIATNDADFEGIQRSVDLSTAARAILSFYFRPVNLEANDILSVDIYNGVTWTQLGTITGADAAGRRTYNISGYMNVNTAIRFVITQNFDQTDESVFFDNVEVSYIVGGTHTATSVLKTVQIYYVPIPEDQGLQVLAAINAAAVSPMFLYVSITVPSDGTVIYYDHWEDGFETMVNNPAQTSTDVWGDNNPANGMPPGYAADILNAGDIIILNNVVDVTGGLSSAVIKYDGGDKIASTEAIAVTRTAWPSGAGTLHGGSVEMLDTSIWGLRYDVPVDDTVPALTPNADFEYTGLTVMASQNGTAIYRNGTLVTTINEGQSYLFTDGNVAIGDVITADKPVQANLLVGDIGSNYASSWYTLYPFDRLSSSYYAPVSSNRRPDTTLIDTAVVVHNPNDSAITVRWETSSGAQTNIAVAAHSYGRVIMPENTAARFYTADGSRFQALSVINTGGQAHDWGYTLIPANQLTQQVKVGWGAGRDPTSGVNPTENGSPIWVTAVGSGTLNICADYNGDGLGALTDSNGSRYDQLITLTTLQRAKVFDSDGDQSGMLLYLCHGSQDNYDNKIAAAWGQDPATASAAAPGLDVGTAVPPLPNFTAIKGAELTGDVNGDGKFDLGDTFEYQIVIKNTGALPIAGGMITVRDIVPQYTTYVTNTTRLDDVLIPDDTAGTAFPLDGVGYTINKTMPIEGQFVVTFRVKIADDLPTSTTIRNEASVSGLSLTYLPVAEIIVDPPTKIGDRIWFDLDGDGVQDAGEPGIPGVTVWLYDSTGTTLLATTVTNAQGLYTFSGLSANTDYIVRVNPASLPGGMTQTGDPDSTLDNQHPVSLGTTPYWNADFGYQGNVSIGDLVWYDADRDGVQDGGSEVGLDGVTVNLTWAGPDGVLGTADDVAFTQVTANGGAYNFTGLPAGTYRVDVDDSTLPTNYALTTADPLTYINVSAGTTITNADFGAASGASIGDFVWHDIDGDGVQDAGEGGIAGVRVFVDRDGDGVWDPDEWYAITDANGAYLITHIPPGTHTVRMDTSTIPAGYSLTTANPLTGIAVVANQVYRDADFGLRAAVLLGIVKASSANGQVRPGDTIYYTLTVRNNTAIAQTGVSVLDALPAGTTYMAQSTVVAGYQLSSGTLIYRDEFNAQSYTNNNGTANWTAGWVETDAETPTSPTAGYIQVVNNGTGQRIYVLRIEKPNSGSQDTRRIYRQANLTSCTDATLTFERSENDLEETIYVDASSNGSTWTPIYSWAGVNSSSQTTWVSSGNISLNSYLGSQVYIRFGGTFGGTSIDQVFFDNIQITCNYQAVIAVTRDNIPGGTNPDLTSGVPSTLVTSADGFQLQPSQQMQVTYRVTVNDPASLESIDNTASVFSAQQVTAQQASTRDFLPARIGDRVWLDRDNDGIQDTNEPGIRGVPVTLTIAYPDGTSTLLTTVTDRDGYYSFNDLFLKSAYNFADSGATFSLSFATPPGMTPSPIGQGGSTVTDSNGAVTAAAPFQQGRTDVTYDSGFTTQRLDLGDLPDTYRTYFSPGPAHIIFPEGGVSHEPATANTVPAVWLGNIVDVEPNGQPGDTAAGDDSITGGVDDEDGLTLPSSVTPGGTTTFTVTVNASESNITVHFGVWIDWDNCGTFDAFYPGSGQSGSPTAVPVPDIAVPMTYTPGSRVYIRVRAADFELFDSDSTGTIINGEVEDYREDWTPTAITLVSFSATLQDGAVLVTWETAMELDNVGFNLYRSTAAAGPYTQLNATLIPPQFPGEVMGGTYEWLDKDVQPGVVYYYKLEDIDVQGASTFHGPVAVTLPGVAETRYFIYLPFVSRTQ